LREELQKKNGERSTYRGIFVRLGRKNRYKPKKIGDEWVHFDTTVLLRDIIDKDGQPICDHLWFNLTKGFEAIGELHEGDEITFDGRVRPYEKGYAGRRDDGDEGFRETDYKLSHPTNIKRTKEAPEIKVVGRSSFAVGDTSGWVELAKNIKPTQQPQSEEKPKVLVQTTLLTCG
jgi:hypothetical protein